MENRRPDHIKPDNLDIRSKSQASTSRPLRSPRLHVAGEAPPELSPLDALRLQSRLLAKKLEEESTRQGRRMSRLPPLTTESPLIVQARSDYFRSLSHDSASDDGEIPGLQTFGPGFRTDVDDDISQRPVSVHPRMSGVPPALDQHEPMPTSLNLDAIRKGLTDVEEQGSFFGIGARREQSPTPMDRNIASVPSEKLSLTRSATQESIPQQSPVSTYSMASSPEKLSRMQTFDVAGLLPPRPSFSKRSSSIMSSQESTDGDGFSSLSTSIHSQAPRKFSNSSGVLSPGLGLSQQSPSISSDISSLPRPNFNFSRPLSRAGTPNLDLPVRQASSDSHSSLIFVDDLANTPVSMQGEGFPDAHTEDSKATSSYIYSKYTLPRGKALQRSPDEHIVPFSPLAHAQTFPAGGQPPPSPPTRPSSSSAVRLQDENYTRPSFEPSKLSMEIANQPTSLDLSRQSTESEDGRRGRPLTSPLHDEARGKTPMSAATSDSASTIRPTRSLYSSNAPTMSDLSAEEHVAKAIELHENGALQESTWHLRHAAKQNHPTGMLLYALACRHGWGMRPNQREGVDWLRKAAESASLEIADDENHAKEGKPVDVLERKTRKAQFALSVYELGISFMNGWGTEQDKPLALRCFEIAGSWGDVDALAEAGFCYAQGVGCKKDLKKSAKFYREAEAKGMSMVGNSWIHKAKYSDDSESVKSRSKSRTRKGFFSRKGKT